MQFTVHVQTNNHSYTNIAYIHIFTQKSRWHSLISGSFWFMTTTYHSVVLSGPRHPAKIEWEMLGELKTNKSNWQTHNTVIGTTFFFIETITMALFDKEQWKNRSLDSCKVLTCGLQTLQLRKLWYYWRNQKPNDFTIKGIMWKD